MIKETARHILEAKSRCRKADEDNSKLHLTKREFLKVSGMGFCALSLPGLFHSRKSWAARAVKKGLIKRRLSTYFTPLDGDRIRCELCPRRCVVHGGKRGFCRVRENREGKYYSLVYGAPCAVNLDPIEKKPFLHVLPGSRSLSLATAGCNLTCKFCQNWEISQASPEDVYSYDVPPERAMKKARQMGARSIAYTYVEPTVFYEYMFDVALLAKRVGLLNVMHSAGFINPEPLKNLCKVMNAVNIDLKGFTDFFYLNLCNGQLSPVLEALRIVREAKIHLEITNLVIPTKNDDPSLIRKMCLWIKEELGPDIPLHFSRFYPLYKLTKLPPTPVSTLEKARETALSCGLEYVYIGNVPGHEAWNTFCPACRRVVIQRAGYMVKEMHAEKGVCEYCGKTLPGIWV